MRCNVGKNRKDHSFDQQYKSIEQLIREADSLSPEQMEKQMEWAEAEAASETPLGGKKIPSPPDNEFEIIRSKMEARGITPRVMAEFDQEQQEAFQSESGFLEAQKEWFTLHSDAQKSRAKFRHFWKRSGNREGGKKKPLPYCFRTAGAAAACMVAAIAIFNLRPELDVMGKRNYTYVSRVREGDKTSIVWNNQEDYISSEGKLEEAYTKIKAELGMPVMRLNYIPIGMKFSELVIENGHARLELKCKDNYIYVLQVHYLKDNSDINFTDSEPYDKIYNELIDETIPIRRMMVNGGKYEYYAYLKMGGTRYYLQGIMNEADFFCVVENLSIEQ